MSIISDIELVASELEKILPILQALPVSSEIAGILEVVQKILPILKAL